MFICYKETDNNGRRTPDSVLANDLYHQLTQEGFKVFFSRITLEDKLGSAYEPYIFAALNSAKVMVVLGTKPEYFNAVWVKNEWARYLALIKNGAKKMLIPAYKDMDPYDLPEEFSHLQAQDMSKLGFMQDLIRGIKKIAQSDEPKQTVVKETVISGGNANTVSLLKRVFIFLEDEDWESADKYCEKVLDIDPENAQAYLGKLMAWLRVSNIESLKNVAKPFDGDDDYQKVMRFGDEELKSTLIGYIEHINTRNENERLEKAYNKAKNAMSAAKTESEYNEAAQLFKAINEYKDSATLAKECYESAEIARKDAILNEAKTWMTNNVANCEKAIAKFESISGWKDADEQIIACQRKIEEIKAKEEAERLEKERQAEIAEKEAKRKAKRNKKIIAITVPIVCFAIAFMILLNTVIIPAQNKRNFIATYGQDVYDKFNSVEIGDYVTFGKYEQDNDTSNGKEDIEWLVLENKSGKILLISKYALYCKQYNTSDEDVTWETCTLRKWLNSDFINTAFSEDEKAMIPTVKVSADKNPKYSTNPGKATQDRIFLLSITEANKYFNSDSERKCKPTDYAVAKVAYVYDGNGSCFWWLRSPGTYQTCASIASRDGSVTCTGYSVDHVRVCVRPALWLDLGA